MNLGWSTALQPFSQKGFGDNCVWAWDTLSLAVWPRVHHSRRAGELFLHFKLRTALGALWCHPFSNPDSEGGSPASPVNYCWQCVWELVCLMQLGQDSTCTRLMDNNHTHGSHIHRQELSWVPPAVFRCVPKVHVCRCPTAHCSGQQIFHFATVLRESSKISSMDGIAFVGFGIKKD